MPKIDFSYCEAYAIGPTFTHISLLKNVNFKIQFVLRFVL